MEETTEAVKNSGRVDWNSILGMFKSLFNLLAGIFNSLKDLFDKAPKK